MKYHAFISYSHRDKVWGDWLHRSLETYRVPPQLVGRETARGHAVPARVYPVFRDREELPTATDLGAVIGEALRQSRYLLVICSPRSARSLWVNQEIVSFKRLHGEHRVLALIVDGEPNAADGKPGFTAEQECFPEALKYQLGADGELDRSRPTEPIAGDARPHADGKANALLKLLAGVLGVNYDDLRRRDEIRRRRRLRVMLATVTTLTVVFAGLAVVATLQSIEARRQRTVAEAERDRAEAARRRALETTAQIQRNNERQALVAGRFDDALLWLEEGRGTRRELGEATDLIDLRKGVYLPRLSRPEWNLPAPRVPNQVQQVAPGAPVWLWHPGGLFQAERDAGGTWQAAAVPWPFDTAYGFGVEASTGGVLMAADRAVHRYDPAAGEWTEVATEGGGVVESRVLTDAAGGRLGWLRGDRFEVWDDRRGGVTDRVELAGLDGFVAFTGCWDSAAGVLAFKGGRGNDRRMLVFDWPAGTLRHDLPRQPAFPETLAVGRGRLVSGGSGGDRDLGELVVVDLAGAESPRRRVTPWRIRQILTLEEAGPVVLTSDGAVREFDWQLESRGEPIWLREGAGEVYVRRLGDGWLLGAAEGTRWAADWREFAPLLPTAGAAEGFAAGWSERIWVWSPGVLAEIEADRGRVVRFARLQVEQFQPGRREDEGWALQDGSLLRLRLSAGDAAGRMSVEERSRRLLPGRVDRLLAYGDDLLLTGEDGGFEVDGETGEVRRVLWSGPRALVAVHPDGLWTVRAHEELGRLEVQHLAWGQWRPAGQLQVLIDPAEVAALTINAYGPTKLTAGLRDGTVLSWPLQTDMLESLWATENERRSVTRADAMQVTGRSGREPRVLEVTDEGDALVAYGDGGVVLWGARGEQLAEFSPFGAEPVAEIGRVLPEGAWLFRHQYGGLAGWRLGQAPRYVRPTGHTAGAGNAVALGDSVFYLRQTEVEWWQPDGPIELRSNSEMRDPLNYLALDPGARVLVGINRRGVGQYWPATDYGWEERGRDFPWGSGADSGSFAWAAPGRLVLSTASAQLPAVMVLDYEAEAQRWAVRFSAPKEDLGIDHEASHVAAAGDVVWLGDETEPRVSRLDLVTRARISARLAEPVRELAVAGPDGRWLVVGGNSRIAWLDAATLAPVGELAIPRRLTGNQNFYTRMIVPLPESTQVLAGTRGAILQVDLATGRIVHEYETDGYVWSLRINPATGRAEYVTDAGAGSLPLPATGELLGRPLRDLVPGRAVLRGAATDRAPGYTFDAP